MFWDVLFRRSREFPPNVTSISDDRACSEEYRGQATNRYRQSTRTFAGTGVCDEESGELDDEADRRKLKTKLDCDYVEYMGGYLPEDQEVETEVFRAK